MYTPRDAIFRRSGTNRRCSGDGTGPDAFSSASGLTWSNVFSAFDVARRTVRFARRNPAAEETVLSPGTISLSAEEDKRFFCRAKQLEKPCATLRLATARKRQGRSIRLRKKIQRKKARRRVRRARLARTFQKAKVPRDDVDVKLVTDVDVNFKFWRETMVMVETQKLLNVTIVTLSRPAGIRLNWRYLGRKIVSVQRPERFYIKSHRIVNSLKYKFLMRIEFY